MGRVLIAGEPGAEIVAAARADRRRDRHREAGQGRVLRHRARDVLEELGTKHLVFAGVTTEVCVQTTMREANDRGFDCLLAEDATESYFPEFKAATLDMIRAQGAIVGWTAPTDRVLEAIVVSGADARAASERRMALARLRAVSAWRRDVPTGRWRRECWRVSPSCAMRQAPRFPGICIRGWRPCLVLEGSQSDEGGRYQAGAIVFNAAGTEHSVWSEDGCVVLIQWERPVLILKEDEFEREAKRPDARA